MRLPFINHRAKLLSQCHLKQYSRKIKYLKNHLKFSLIKLMMLSLQAGILRNMIRINNLDMKASTKRKMSMMLKEKKDKINSTKISPSSPKLIKARMKRYKKM